MPRYSQWPQWHDQNQDWGWRLLTGFEGELTTSKYAKCSQDTAYRDVLALIEQGVLVQNPERRAEHELFTRIGAITVVAPGLQAIVTRLGRDCASWKLCEKG